MAFLRPLATITLSVDTLSVISDPLKSRKECEECRVLQFHGGMGYTKELPIERWYREARLWRIYDGTDEIQRLIISRNLLKGHVKIGQFI